MTTSPNADEPDTEGKTVPPYDGRKKEADIGDADESIKDGSRTGGASRPVENDGADVDDPTRTERGEHASPADEQPASTTAGSDTDTDMTGPGHVPGAGRAEDKS